MGRRRGTYRESMWKRRKAIAQYRQRQFEKWSKELEEEELPFLALNEIYYYTSEEELLDMLLKGQLTKEMYEDIMKVRRERDESILRVFNIYTLKSIVGSELQKQINEGQIKAVYVYPDGKKRLISKIQDDFTIVFPDGSSMSSLSPETRIQIVKG